MKRPAKTKSSKINKKPVKKRKRGLNDSEFVYLIREREFRRLGEETYKLGKTTQPPNSRLRGYPNESEIVMFIEVEDCDKTERALIAEFDKRYILMKQYGREYYQGDRRAMQKTFMRIACTTNETIVSQKKSWFWWTWRLLF